MKIGIIADIHNNVLALNAVLDRLKNENCEHIICCGDIIGIGPYPEETVKHIMQISNLIAVRGNHESYLLDGMPTQFPNDEGMDYDEMEHHKWEHSLLSHESVDFLRKLPYRRDFTLDGLDFSVMHYCMDNSYKYINYTPSPTIENCCQMFSDNNAGIILYGHDHAPTMNKYEHKLFINVGSLGCPANDGNIARAGILTTQNGKVDFEFVNVEYDVQKVIDDINKLNYPAMNEIKMYFYNIKN